MKRLLITSAMLLAFCCVSFGEVYVDGKQVAIADGGDADTLDGKVWSDITGTWLYWDGTNLNATGLVSEASYATGTGLVYEAFEAADGILDTKINVESQRIDAVISGGSAANWSTNPAVSERS